jgi:molybdopterin synthase catalytic subunit/molybdopterin converting factor small subunit
VTIRVLFFAYLRDVTGTPAIELAVSDGATPRSVWSELSSRWPELEHQLVRLPIVVDGKVVDLDTAIPPGAEVVWLPPVGGGSGSGAGCVVRAALTEGPLDTARLLSEVSHPSCGGIVAFVGEVREEEDGRPVRALTYQAYDMLAQAQLVAVAEEAAGRWPSARIALEHRTGRLVVGEASVAIAVACPHRADAFACCRFLIDRLKEAVPIWKREEGEGGERWLAGHDYRPGAGEPGDA